MNTSVIVFIIICVVELVIIVSLVDTLADERMEKEALEKDLAEYESEKLSSGFEKQAYYPYENLYEKWKEQEENDGEEKEEVKGQVP